MDKTKKIFVLLLVIGLGVAITVKLATDSETKVQKIQLDVSKLSANWSVGVVGVVNKGTEEILKKYSQELGGEISKLNQYNLNVGGKSAILSLIEPKTREDANKIYRNLLHNKFKFKSGFESYKKKGKKIIIYNSREQTVVEKAKKLDLITGTPKTFSIADKLDSNFLQNNYSVINLADQDFSSFDLLNERVKKNQVFLTGELHGVAVNPKLRLKFLKYFKKNADIKYYLVELPYTTAQSLNEYLQTGNEEILARLFDRMKNANHGTQGNYEFWQKLYEFNNTLPSDEKIKVVGVDIEHAVQSAISHLISLLPFEKEPPANIASFVNKLKRYPIDGDEKMFFEKLSKSLEDNYNTYQRFLGNDKVFVFKLVTQNILTSIKRDRLSEGQETWEKSRQIRDQQIYENFKQLYSRLPDGKYYGQWGLNHVYQKSQRNIDWFASLLDSPDSPVQGQVLSIAYYYSNSRRRIPEVEEAQRFTSNYSSILKLNSITDHKLTLFKLPQNKPSVLYKPPGAVAGELTDYYQYLILIQNAEASTGWSSD